MLLRHRERLWYPRRQVNTLILLNGSIPLYPRVGGRSFMIRCQLLMRIKHQHVTWGLLSRRFAPGQVYCVVITQRSLSLHGDVTLNRSLLDIRWSTGWENVLRSLVSMIWLGGGCCLESDLVV